MGEKKSNNSLRELRGWRLYGYSFGIFGMMLPFTLVNGYAFQFYVYTIGLDALIVSVGLFLGAIIFGIFSIVFGVMADNKTPTRFGKRKLVFLWGIIPYCIISVFIWISPWKNPENMPIYLPTAIYFCSMIFFYRIVYALLLSPYNSIFPDISQTESNRIKVTGIQVLLSTISGLIGMLLPVLIQASVEDPLHTKWWEPSGEKIIKLIPWVGGIFGGIALIILVFTFVSIDEKFHYNNFIKTSDEEKEEISRPNSLRESFQHIFIPMRDSEYKKLIISIGLSEMGTIIIGIVFLPFLTYVLELQEMQFIWSYAIGTPLLFIGLKIWQIILKKYGLIKGLQLNFLISLVFALLPVIFFLQLPSWLSISLGIFILSGSMANVMGKYLFFSPIISQMIDISPFKNEKKENLSGAYFGLNLFVTNISMGFANLILGIILSGSRAENPTFILLVYPVLAIIFFLAWSILRRMKFSKLDQN